MKTVGVGELTLVVSNEFEGSSEEFQARLSDEGIKSVRVTIEGNDGSLHTLDVLDHFLNWEEIKEKATK
jgi:hypothetical protein